METRLAHLNHISEACAWVGMVCDLSLEALMGQTRSGVQTDANKKMMVFSAPPERRTAKEGTRPTCPLSTLSLLTTVRRDISLHPSLSPKPLLSRGEPPPPLLYVLCLGLFRSRVQP